MSDLAVRPTPIPGLLLLSLPVHGDRRGWFKENWQREKMVALGLPDFGPVQNNVSFNAVRGTTRGIHAEPWDKLISVATGRVFGAWVDLREGESFGTTFTAEIDPMSAAFVPRGVGNGFQTLQDDTTYSYLVNDHWRPGIEYTAVNVADPSVAIPWPLPLEGSVLSDKDATHPFLDAVTAIKPRKTLITGAGGQLANALVDMLPDAVVTSEHEFDISDPAHYEQFNWREFDTIINAAAYTDVDAAETADGRRAAWKVNGHGVSLLARTALQHDLTLAHISTDYVFDGSIEEHSTTELFAPLNVYGASKAAGDLAVSVAPRHYIVRTSWLIGDGPNFVRTMRALAENGVDPSVVDDQFGRLTHTADLAAGLVSLLDRSAPYGIYNITSGGPAKSWFEIAQEVFAEAGHDPGRVTACSTQEYAAGKALAPRPRHSSLA